MQMLVLTALLAGAPLLAPRPASAGHASARGIIALAAIAPAGTNSTNQPFTNVARSNIPVPTRSHVRAKAGLLATGALIAITILIVACGLALLSSFKKR